MPRTIPQIPDIATGGGHGTVTAWARPDLVLSAPGGIGGYTPANYILSAGHTASLVAQQDLQVLAQANHATAAKDGVVLYTVGQATNPERPVDETGIRLHAASGSVSMQSQSGATRLTADGQVQVASTTGQVRITAPKHILLSAGGAGIRMEGDHITLTAPGMVQFKASMKELGGPASASVSATTTEAPPLFDEAFRVLDEHSGEPMAFYKYRIENARGEVLARGITDEQGRARRVLTAAAETLRIVADEE